MCNHQRYHFGKPVVNRLLAVGLFALLSGCMVGPDYQRRDINIVENWHADLAHIPVQETTLADEAWIDIFRDDELRNVLQQALAQNRELLIAIERIEEARAVHRINRASLFPAFDLALSGERERDSALTEAAPDIEDELFFGTSARWELDLWGKNRRSNRAAWANYLASEYGAQAVRLSLIAQTSRVYFQLEGINARLKISYDTLAARDKALVIAEKRFHGGLTSKLEVKQSEVEVANARASIPKIEQAKLAVENELAVIMGLQPQHLELSSELEEQYVPSMVTSGLPSSLLERRPDIMQAEQLLISASERIGVAKAGLFPNIAITGDLGIQSADFDDLLDSDGKYWIFEVDIAMPLFHAGARRAELSAAESRFNQARLAYEQRVLESLREVSDALNQFHKSGETLAAELYLEDASSEYYELANKRYRNGVLAYIDVLDAQRQLLNAQLAVSVARQAQLIALVDLYKALGGGWDPAAQEFSSTH